MEQREKVEHSKMGKLLRLKMWANRRLVLIVMSLVGLFILAAVGTWFYRTYVDSGNGQQFSEYRQEYQELKKNKPTTAEISALAEYYQLLASKAAKAGDYKGAVSAFEDRKKVLGSKMPPVEYIELAVFYCRMDDKNEAILAIEQGVADQRASADDRSRFQSAIKSINEQGCDAWVSPLDQQ